MNPTGKGKRRKPKRRDDLKENMGVMGINSNQFIFPQCDRYDTFVGRRRTEVTNIILKTNNKTLIKIQAIQIMKCY